MELAEIMNHHGSDKARKHRYHEVYEPALSHLRGGAFTMLEVGVFKGCGIRAWAEYFPHAHIDGLDLFKRVPMEDVEVPSRVILFKGDSTTWNALGPYMVIVDDGCHEPDVQAATLRNLWPHLEEGGFYFIEDVFTDMRNQWAMMHNDRYNLAALGRLSAKVEARDPHWKKTDMSTGHPDSCIIMLRKGER